MVLALAVLCGAAATQPPRHSPPTAAAPPLGEAPELYRPVHGGSWSGRAAPLSDDPMVAYRWAPGANTTELQLLTRAPTRVVVQAGRCAQAQRLLGPSPLRVAIAEPTRLMLDFGVELPAWWEIDSPDLAASNAVLSMGVGEYNTPWQEGPGRHKTGRPKRYGSTYRLETGNAALYEGVRFAFLEVSAPPGATLIPFTITGARLVVQTKPVNYAGHFTASDPMVVSRTIMALEQHIWPRSQETTVRTGEGVVDGGV